jgi:hypothetical protein
MHRSIRTTLDIPDGYFICVRPRWTQNQLIILNLDDQYPEPFSEMYYTYILTKLCDHSMIKDWQIEVASFKRCREFIMRVSVDGLTLKQSPRYDIPDTVTIFMSQIVLFGKIFVKTLS